MARTAVLGFPRIGAKRELKTALEDYWNGQSDAAVLQATARDVREANLRAGSDAGIDVLPVGDFALYDHVLDTAELAGIVAERHTSAQTDALDAHFVACRGAEGLTPLEMTKWFDTNYHYLVPELTPGQAFRPRHDKWLAHLREAADLGVAARPVVLGPMSLLLLCKGASKPLDLLPALTPVYAELLSALAAAGAREVQLDEPCLVLDRDAAELDAFRSAYAEL
jgi:5-methyltetrahydropteroyltriglutamate--homocysteine methyltransferase